MESFNSINRRIKAKLTEVKKKRKIYTYITENHVNTIKI